ncbi:hypothetical protein FQN50_000337 [Emmonsiellopsis sp. PD_5]|nr:hypothetical protein FQN50_000337 [Emmonsiellopsis sp. PD_5]
MSDNNDSRKGKEREETEFFINISKENAQALDEQGRSSQKNHGIARGLQPTSGGPDQLKFPSPTEEYLLMQSGLESQERKKGKK